jgi:hypothetical protein
VISKLHLSLKAIMFATVRSAVRIVAAVGMIFTACMIDVGHAAARPAEKAYCGAPGVQSLATAPGVGRFGWIVDCLPSHGPVETRLVLSAPDSGERMVTIGLHLGVRMLGFDSSGEVYWASTQAKDTLQAASRRLTIWGYRDGGQIREAAALDLPFEAEIGERIDVPDGWLIRLHSASGRMPERGLFLFYRRGEIKVADTAFIGKLLWRAGPNAFLYRDREGTLRAIDLDGHDAPEVAKTYAPALQMLEPWDHYAGDPGGQVALRIQDNSDTHVYSASMITAPATPGATANAQSLATWRDDWLKTVTMSADGRKAAFAFSARIEVLTSADGWRNARVLPYDDAFQSDIAFDASGTTLIAISQAVRRWSIAP